MVYIEIAAFSFAMNSGPWNLTLTKFTVSNGTGGGGNGTGGGGSSATNCTGSGTVAPDILEPNDATTTATQVSVLPLTCTGLSIHSSSDVDYFQVDMITGVTYYVNVTLNNANGDLDTGWDTASGLFLDSSGTTGSLESMQVTATANQTTYVDVFGWLGATNTYDIEITTDNPGGGQSLELAYVNIFNDTNATVSFAGLQSNTTYNYTTVLTQSMIGNTSVSYSLGNGTFNSSNSSTYSFDVNYTLDSNESTLEIVTLLYDANGVLITTGSDEFEIEMLVVDATSSTTGDINLTNLSIGTTYDLYWVVYDENIFITTYFANNNSIDAALNASIIDEGLDTFTTQSETRDYNITWNGPTTTSSHGFVAILSVNGTVINFESNENYTAADDDSFIPQLPSIVISSVSSSVNSATNDVTTRGLDLVVGDTYKYRIKILDSGNATLSLIHI